MYFTKSVSLIFIVTVLSGCSITRNVQTAAGQIETGNSICIELNTKVTEPDILDVIKQSIARNGFIIETHAKVPESCELKLTYVAYRKWDVTTFLSQANINLYKNNQLIGSIEYKTPTGLVGAGGINPAKWDSTEEKIAPLMDKLLKM